MRSQLTRASLFVATDDSGARDDLNRVRAPLATTIRRRRFGDDDVPTGWIYSINTKKMCKIKYLLCDAVVRLVVDRVLFLVVENARAPFIFQTRLCLVFIFEMYHHRDFEDNQPLRGVGHATRRDTTRRDVEEKEKKKERTRDDASIVSGEAVLQGTER